MPGLLQIPSGRFYSGQFLAAVLAEFVGSLLFTLCGGVSPFGKAVGQVQFKTEGAVADFTPWGNGLTLAALVYITANVSGGHLNPAVTLATMVTGHISVKKGCVYILAQLVGSIFGALLTAGLVPGAEVGQGIGAVGCFHEYAGVSPGQLFGWELMMTFVLVSVVYAVAVGEPNFGIVGPLIVGLTLSAMVSIGSQYTGASLNPARVFGPTVVYHCFWNRLWIYWLGEFLGGLAAGIVAWPLYGTTAPWLLALGSWSRQPEGYDAAAGKAAHTASEDEGRV
ncbi:hypothetical protein WJX72_001022 [[Myrmecia] bisecta]|uniref:Aquaporin n=1 Tax=[Myrmecia] bisecta TaxID=41462 RepID=A0AAW1P377_9CHLO